MSLESTLTTYGQIGVDTLRDAVAPHDATGKTRESIRFVVEGGERLMFIAREFFQLLEKGIRPSSKKPSKEMIDMMTEYARARGFDNPEKAAWAISINQLKEGDTTFKKGGRVVYSDVMATFTKELGEELAKDHGMTLSRQFKEAFK